MWQTRFISKSVTESGEVALLESEPPLYTTNLLRSLPHSSQSSYFIIQPLIHSTLKLNFHHHAICTTYPSRPSLQANSLWQLQCFYSNIGRQACARHVWMHVLICVMKFIGSISRPRSSLSKSGFLRAYIKRTTGNPLTVKQLSRYTKYSKKAIDFNDKGIHIFILPLCVD